MKKIALYVRCSTDHQTVQNQIHALESYCNSQVWKNIPRDYYKEEGVSARKIKPALRPAFGDLLEKCREGVYEKIVILRIDRLCRNIRDLCEICQDLSDLGVELVFVQPNMPTTGPLGKLVLGIFGLIAEFEADLIAERIKEGLAAKKAQGIKLGKRYIPFSEDIWKQIQELGQNQLSLREIGRNLNIPHSTLCDRIKTLSGIIESPFKEWTDHEWHLAWKANKELQKIN